MEYRYSRISQDELVERFGGQRRHVIAHTSTGPIYLEGGVVWMYPLHTGLQRMRDLHVRAVEPEGHVSLASVRRLSRPGAGALHQRAVSAALATLRVASDEEQLELCRGVFHFARKAGSSDGIESVLLSAIVTANRLSPSLTGMGLETWLQVGPPTRLGGGLSQTPVFDPASSVVSFLGQGDLADFSGMLAGLAGQGPARHPGPGGLAPGGNEEDTQKDGTCVAVLTIGFGIVGIIGGVLAANSAAGGSATTTSRNSGDIGGGAIGGIGGAAFGLSLGQMFCGDASPATPSADNGTTTTGTSDDTAGYNEGFDQGWAAATDTQIGAGPTVGAGYSQGYMDGFAAAAAMATLSTPTTAPTDTTPTDGSTVVDGTTEAPTDGSTTTTTDNSGTQTDGTPTGGTSPDGTPTDGGTPPTSSSTPDPEGDDSAANDHEGGTAFYTHGSATGPGLAGSLTKLSGGGSYVIPSLGQGRGAGGGVTGVVPGIGPDDRDTGDGTDGSQDSLPLGGHISIDLPAGRDPENNPHAFSSLTEGAAF